MQRLAHKKWVWGGQHEGDPKGSWNELSLGQSNGDKESSGNEAGAGIGSAKTE